MSNRVDGKIALVTGAARGQGRSHCVRLAEEGASIIGIDLCGQIDSVAYALADSSDLNVTKRAVEKTGGRMVAMQGDVRSIQDLKHVVELGTSTFGGINVVCANAGIGSLGSSWELTPEQWSDVIDVNLTGVWNTIRATVPQMIASGQGGSIIFISSVAGSIGRRRMSHYTAAKHGLIGLMRSLANELGEYHIRVNVISPTNVDTGMIHNDTSYRLYSDLDGTPSPKLFAEAATALNVIPIPWVEAIDVSNAVLWLASEEARYVTGAVIPVDAGAAIKSP